MLDTGLFVMVLSEPMITCSNSEILFILCLLYSEDHKDGECMGERSISHLFPAEVFSLLHGL